MDFNMCSPEANMSPWEPPPEPTTPWSHLDFAEGGAGLPKMPEEPGLVSEGIGPIGPLIGLGSGESFGKIVGGEVGSDIVNRLTPGM